MISNWTSSIALIQLITRSDNTPGLSSMTFIWFVMYSVVRCSVGGNLAVAEVFNLLLNLIESAVSNLSVKLKLYVSCVLWVAEKAAKSEDSSSASKPLAFHWFEDIPSESSIVCCF